MTIEQSKSGINRNKQKKNEALICHFGIWGGGEQRSTTGDGTVLCVFLDGNVHPLTIFGMCGVDAPVIYNLRER